MNDSYGCARKLYEANRHPRVLCSAADIERIRREVRSGVGRKLMAGLREVLAPMAAAVRDDGHLDERFGELYTKPQQTALCAALIRLWDIAAVAVLDEDEAMIQALDKVFARMARCTDLNLTPGWPSGPHWMIAYDLLYPRLKDETRRAFAAWAERYLLRDMLDELRRNRHIRSAGGNVAVCHLITALVTALALQGEEGVGDLTPAIRELRDMHEASLWTTMGRDGYPTEDIGYGSSVVAAMAVTAEALRRAGLYDAHRECPRYLQAGRALLHFVQPWGSHLTNTGDHCASIDHREFLLATQAMATKDRTVLWLSESLVYPPFSRGPWGTAVRMWMEVPIGKGRNVPASFLSLLRLDAWRRPPLHPSRSKEPTSFLDRDRGIVTFRSGWKPGDTYVVFDGAHRPAACQGHHHASCGHFGLSAAGEQFAIDMGRYGTEQSEHNMVLVDGKSGRSTEGQWGMLGFMHGVMTEYAPDPFCDYAAVDSTVQHNCFWARRHIGLVKGQGLASGYVWTVEDVNKANDWAEFWWTLNTSPENTIALHGASATITGWRHGNRMDVHFALPDAAEYPKPHTLVLAQDECTTSSFKYIANPRERVRDYERPADQVHGPVFVRPRLIGKVAGYNGRFMAIMLPRLKDEAPAKVERLPSPMCSLAVRITFAAVEDTVIFAYEHNLLEAGDISGRGRWCVVRRARRNGRILGHAMGDGTMLRVGGKDIPGIGRGRVKRRR